MNDYFKGILNKEPYEIINGDYYFNTDNAGDSFDESDAEEWLTGGFKRRWENASQNRDFLFADDVINTFSKNPAPFLEIACGPGMGLTPVILSKYPQIPCMVSDASSLLIKSWMEYLNINSMTQYDINLASFSVLDMPIKSNSLDTVTSFLGIGSTRNGEQGEIEALKEVFRILKNDGYFIAVENEWNDHEAIKRVFELWGKPVWDGMIKEKTWQTKFLETGFDVESCDKTYGRYLLKQDNELGEQADKFGIKIELKFTLFVARKKIDSVESTVFPQNFSK